MFQTNIGLHWDTGTYMYKKIMTVIHGGVQSQLIMNNVIWIPE